MGPDIHWHVGEDDKQETVVTSAPVRRSRRSGLVLLLAVLAGTSLGVLYRSIPEPTPRPTPPPMVTPYPTPTRPAIPARLFEAIDREAQALADGDVQAYRQVRLASVGDEQQTSFTAWGRLGDGRPTYVIVDFDLRTATQAWADIRQFRNGRWFRETRFYLRENDRWLRNLRPDVLLWSGQEEKVQTPHFDVTYALEDRDVLSPTLHQLEEDYQALCRDLGCPTNGQPLTFTLKLKTNEGPNTYPLLAGNSELRLPSPRVTGFYESGRAYHWNNTTSHFTLALAIAERIYGTISYERRGGSLLWASVVWAINRLDPLPVELWAALGELKQTSLLPLDELWNLPESADTGLLIMQGYQFLHFVEQTQGASAVTQLLQALDSADSLPEAIEISVNVPFAEFDQKWQAWIKANIAIH
jgi:hypothetical protein